MAAYLANAGLATSGNFRLPLAINVATRWWRYRSATTLDVLDVGELWGRVLDGPKDCMAQGQIWSWSGSNLRRLDGM